MVYVFTAGEQPTADNLNAIFDQSPIRKASATAYASDATVNNDPDFAVALEVGTYLVWVWMHVASASATPDIKTVWSNTGTMAIARSVMGPQISTADRGATLMLWQGSASTTEVAQGNDGSGNANVYKEELYVEVTVAGTLTFQWSQNTSNATAITASTASRMWVVNVA
jgi:hypothetical protein